MLDPRRLKVAKKDTKIYPGRAAVVCDMLDSDNSIYEATKGKAEVELALHMKCNLPKGVNMDKLLVLIENYGEEKYQEAQCDRDMDDAGADL